MKLQDQFTETIWKDDSVKILVLKRPENPTFLNYHDIEACKSLLFDNIHLFHESKMVHLSQ